MTGSALFYRATKSFHNALQGTRQRITPELYDAFIECNRDNAKRLNLDAEFAMIHDPQPAALIDARPHGATWTSRLLSTRSGSFCARSWSGTTPQSFHFPSSRKGCLFHNFWSTPLSTPSVKRIVNWSLTRSTGFFNDWVCLVINRSCCKCHGSIGSRTRSA